MQPLVLESDEMEAVLLPEHGARLHRIRAFGVDLLRTPDDLTAHDADPFFWGAYVLAPWCNRARPGPMRVAGRTIELAANFHDGTAIHGEVYSRRWHPLDDGWLATRAGDSAWPWSYEVRMRPTLEGRTLRLELELRNGSDGPMPAGIGMHPWFRGSVRVGLAASAVIPRNDEPNAKAVPVAGDLALSVDHPLPGGIDATWLDPRPPQVQLLWPADGVAATLRIRATPAAHVALASPKDVEAVAVEPVTHAPWGLERLAQGAPGAMALIAPGDSIRLDLTLEVRRA